MIGVSSEEVRANGTLDNGGYLISRPLTADEIELVRQSDWLLSEAPIGTYERHPVAIVRGIAGYKAQRKLSFVRVSDEHDRAKRFEYAFDVDLILDEKLIREMIVEIRERFAASLAHYRQYDDEISLNWGNGWPVRNEHAFNPFHSICDGIPTAEAPLDHDFTGDYTPVWMRSR